ncbi:MAG TPA: hypothetical protein VJR48_16265 [Ktedonobacterales bacterium]|nr:hypothetical protein [Ktedonobacterales bacterium]
MTRSQEVQGLFQLLRADTWLKKCEVAQRSLVYLSFMRETLEQEVSLAIQRRAFNDARIFAAHISLLDNIQRSGLAAVQAEIVRTTRCRDYPGS